MDSTKLKSDCRDVLRLLFRLFSRVSVTDTDRGLATMLPPSDLWRLGPQLLERACDLADRVCDDTPEVCADTAFLRRLAQTIRDSSPTGRGVLGAK